MRIFKNLEKIMKTRKNFLKMSVNPADRIVVFERCSIREKVSIYLKSICITIKLFKK